MSDEQIREEPLEKAVEGAAQEFIKAEDVVERIASSVGALPGYLPPDALSLDPEHAIAITGELARRSSIIVHQSAALERIRAVIMDKSKSVNEAWSTIYHILTGTAP